jgi:aryl-alcohol dehydrogenase-like predicted oxidoreductase
MGGLTPFITAQNQYNLLQREVQAEVLPVCSRHAMSMLPFYPLASGYLTGKYRQNEPPPSGTRGASGPMAGRVHLMQTEANYRTLDRLRQFAEEHGRALSELALAWLASQSVVGSVIAGATRPEQVEANVKAIEWRLSLDDIQRVQAIAAEQEA